MRRNTNSPIPNTFVAGLCALLMASPEVRAGDAKPNQSLDAFRNTYQRVADVTPAAKACNIDIRPLIVRLQDTMNRQGVSKDDQAVLYGEFTKNVIESFKGKASEPPNCVAVSARVNSAMLPLIYPEQHENQRERLLREKQRNDMPFR